MFFVYLLDYPDDIILHDNIKKMATETLRWGRTEQKKYNEKSFFFDFFIVVNIELHSSASENLW